MATFKLNLGGLKSIDGNAVQKAAPNDVAVASRTGNVEFHEGPEMKMQEPVPAQEIEFKGPEI